MSFPRYSMYKDSGLEWLGEVPTHWGVVQSRRLFGLRQERARDSDRQLTASQKHGVIYQQDFMALEGQRVVQVLKGADILKHVEPGDFVISMRSFEGGIEWCRSRGCVSSAYVVLVPSDRVHRDFFAYVLKSPTYIQALQTTTNLVRDGQALRYANFTKIPLPLIPLEEQALIASFLRKELGRIEVLMSEQQRLIRLLKEKRQALVSRAVTKGLDQNAKMKSSGVAWLGDVPAHWNLSRTKNLFSVMRRSPAENDEIVTAFRDGEVTLRRNRRVEGFTNAIHEHGYQRVVPGDLVIHAMDAFAGAIGVSDSAGKCSPVYSVCQPKDASTNASYFALLMRHMALSGYINSLSKGIRERSTEFRWKEAANVVLVVPPSSEQHDIVRYVSQEAAKLDALISDARSATSFLQERRTALIYAAVTGKIDVRSLVNAAEAA